MKHVLVKSSSNLRNPSYPDLEGEATILPAIASFAEI